jgi:hypothetical protein
MIFMTLFTLVYCYTLAYIYSPYIPTIDKEKAEWLYLFFTLSVLVLGPGTFSLAILVKGKWSEFKKYIPYAAAFNFFAFYIFIFLLVLMLMRPYLELVGK